MKKLFLIVTVLFISVSGSFAFQQTIYAGPPTNYNGMTVNINATCSYIKFNCSWNNFLNAEANGSAVAYSDLLIGEHYFTAGYTSPFYNSPIISGQYWSIVQVYLSAFSCYGQATLEWAF